MSCFSSGFFRRCLKHPNNKHFTRSVMAGLFFYLASADGAGLLFCPAAIQPLTSVYSGFFCVHAELYRPRYKTAHRALQGLFRLFALFCRCCMSAYPAILHRLCHAGAYHNAVAPPAHTRYQRHAERCTGQHNRPIIIRYIRAYPCYRSMPDSATHRRPCQPGGVNSYRLRIAGKCCTGSPAEGSASPPVQC